MVIKMKNTVRTFQMAKEEGRKISMLTAYDYSTAKLIDEAGIDAILVGDSLGNTILGYEDTVSVTMEDMIHHSVAVARGVKLEGGRSVCPQIKAVTDAGIPVMAHLGLTPQSVNALGGNRVQGKSMEDARNIIEDALAVQEAGAFAVVLECIPAKLATLITKKLAIPTIGIGAGNGCDGQILVYQDMLGMFSGYVPKFVKKFADAGAIMKEAFADYKKEVADGTFPSEEHTFKIDDEVLGKLY